MNLHKTRIEIVRALLNDTINKKIFWIKHEGQKLLGGPIEFRYTCHVPDFHECNGFSFDVTTEERGRMVFLHTFEDVIKKMNYGFSVHSGSYIPEMEEAVATFLEKTPEYVVELKSITSTLFNQVHNEVVTAEDDGTPPEISSYVEEAIQGKSFAYTYK